MSAIPRELVEDVHALSPVQQGIFFHAVLEPELAPYVEQGLWRIRGAVDPEVFERAWNELVARHTILRSVFRQTQRQPVQIVLKERRMEVPCHDWRPLSADGQRDALHELARTERAPFQLADGPLLRLALVRLGADEWRFLWTFHHIILDGLTAAMLLESLCRTYDALAADGAAPADAAPPFSRFVLWLSRQNNEEALRFFATHLDGFTTPTSVPADRQPAETATRTHRGRHVWLGRETTVALEDVARRRRVTVSTLMQAAWAILLARYSGEPDVVFGLTLSGRPAEVAGVERIAGPFINTLPVRVSVAGDPTLADVLRSLQQQFVELDQYSHVSLADIQGRTAVRAPGTLFETAVNVHPPATWNGFRASSFVLGLAEEAGPPVGHTNYDLMVDVALLDSIGITISYAEERYDRAAIDALLANMKTLAEAIAASDPAAPVSSLNLLAPQERSRAVDAFNRTEPTIDFDGGLVARIQAAAARTPNARAVIAGQTRLSYAAVNARANQIAWWLQANGIGREDRVAVFGERSAAWLTFVLGILKAGAAFVPLDPLQPDARLEAIVSSAGARLLACGPESAARGLALAGAASRPPALVCWAAAPANVSIDGAEIWADMPASNPPRASGPRDLCCVFFTSGSTGAPKGVMVEHAGVLNHLHAKISHLGIDRSDVVAQNASIGFDISVWQTFAALTVGGAVAIYEDEIAFDQPRLAAGLARDGVTILETVPSLMDALIDAAAAVGPPALRALVSNAEFLPAPLCRRWLERFPQIPLVNTYGATECSDDNTHHSQREAPPEATIRIPVGRPMPGGRIYVVDGTLEPVPVGAPGEIAIGGVGVGRGYLDDPVKTALAFVPDPFSGELGARMYLTGDIGRWNHDGVLEWLRRDGDQVKVRGHRIELGEIEAALLRSSGVRQAVAVVQQSAQGDPQIVAYWVGANEVAVERLRESLAAALPRYMLPAAIVRLDAFPLTANGKVNRRALPPPPLEAADGARVAPEGAIEGAIAGIWSEVLGVEQVGATDNFFDLGGQSLKTMQIRSRLTQRFGVDVALRSIFRHQTVREQARIVTEALHAHGSGPASIPRAPEAERYPLSRAQRRLWILHQLDPADTSYNLVAPLSIEGPLDAGALDRAWSGLVERQASLRTVFESIDAEPRQRIVSAGPQPLPRIDLAERPHDERARDVERIVRELRGAPFTLDTPPVRAVLIALAPDRHLLILVLHHLVSDGWSGDVLLRDLLELYRAVRTGGEPQLAPMAIRYVDYAAWQNDRFAAGAYAEHERFWMTQLAGELPALALPASVDTSAPAAGAHTLTFSIDAETAERVKHATADRDVTPFMLKLALLKSWLSRFTGTEDLVVGGPVSGRDQPETEPLVGFFVNLVPMRTSLASDPTLTEAIARVKRTCLDAYAHQEYPYDELVKRLKPRRQAGGAAIFDVLFLTGRAGGSRSVEGLTIATASELADRGGTGFPGAQVALTAVCVEQSDGRQLWALSFDGTRTDRAVAEDAAARFEAFIREAARRPHARLSTLDVLPEPERRRLVEAVNATMTPYPSSISVQRLFESEAAARPHVVALRGNGREWTYEALNADANRLARHFVAHGAGPGTIVATFLDRSPDLVIVLLAILKTGAAYLPLDVDEGVERLALMLDDAGRPLVATNAALASRLPPPPVSPRLVLDRDAHAIAAADARNLPYDGTGDSLAYVMYTSGSTGQPKGVMIPHRGIIRLVRETSWAPFGPGECIAHMSKCSFDASTIEIWGALLNGAALVTIAQDTMLSLPALAATFERERVTTGFMTTAFFHLVVREGPQCLDGFTSLLVGGEVLSPAIARRALDRQPGLQFLNVYGPTENTSLTTAQVVDRSLAESTSIPIGLPISNTSVYIVNAAMQPVGVGVMGELLTGGDGLAAGYLGRPDLTAEKFIPDPFSGVPGARLYRTGDVVSWRADGRIAFHGRFDHQVKIRGHRVELGEIEATLRQHPTVADAIVLARETGGGDKQLAAYVVAAPGAAIHAEALRRHASAHLPPYMVPAWVIPLAAFPLGRTGKVDRTALPAPEHVRDVAGVEYVAPRGDVEEKIARVWRELLAVDAVGVNDNFFDLGGDSLQAIVAVSRLGERGIRVTPKLFFANPTVASLAAVVEHAGTAAAIDRQVVLEPAPLVPIQRFFFEQQLECAHHWNAGTLLKAERLDAGAVERALQALLDHHDALRMRFSEGPDGWRQHNPGVGERVSFEVFDVGSDLARLAAEGARIQASFDFVRGPIFRAALFRLADGTDRLLVTAHHLVSDNVSGRILVDDLASAYEQALRGGPIELQAKTTAYARWAQVLEAHAPARSAELPYWQSVVEGGWAPLPLDHDLGPNTMESATGARFQLDPHPTRILLTTARPTLGVEMHDLLLSALARVVGEWTRTSSVGLLVEGHGRQAIADGVDVSRTIGWFTTMYPIRIEVPNDVDQVEYLQRTRDVLAAVPAGGLGYGALRYLARRPELAGWPLPDVNFNYQGQYVTGASTSSRFSTGREDAGRLIGARGRRWALLSVECAIVDGRLVGGIGYSRHKHLAETIDALAQRFTRELRDIAALCAEWTNDTRESAARVEPAAGVQAPC
jgi:amino acid adenylation domain-containing protein/non-ribosomal peptide synthase protein (TIGR01720 family)